MQSLNERVGLAVSRANLKVISSSTAMHWELVKLGVGISVIPDRLGDAEPGRGKQLLRCGGARGSRVRLLGIHAIFWPFSPARAGEKVAPRSGAG